MRTRTTGSCDWTMATCTGATVATALAEQRPDAVTALALIDMGPTPDAKIPERLLVRLLLSRFPGPLLWHLKTEGTIRKAARTGFTRPVEVPDAMIQDVLGMTYRAFAGTLRAPCPAPASSCSRAWDTPRSWKTRERPPHCCWSSPPPPHRRVSRDRCR